MISAKKKKIDSVHKEDCKKVRVRNRCAILFVELLKTTFLLFFFDHPILFLGSATTYVFFVFQNGLQSRFLTGDDRKLAHSYVQRPSQPAVDVRGRMCACIFLVVVFAHNDVDTSVFVTGSYSNGCLKKERIHDENRPVSGFRENKKAKGET